MSNIQARSIQIFFIYLYRSHWRRSEKTESECLTNNWIFNEYYSLLYNCVFIIMYYLDILQYIESYMIFLSIARKAELDSLNTIIRWRFLSNV